MRPPLRAWAFLVLVFGLALLPSPAAAQGGEPTDDEVNAIARQLYCPVCENVPLDVCPTQACAQWRAIIRQMLAEGRTEQEIKDYFVVQYGERVLAAPPPRGFNWLAYIIPAAAFVVAVSMLARTLRRWMRPAHLDAAPEMPAADDPYVERLEQELRRRA
jgi:cytochrome c-type biogenesis protein CcmH